MRMRQQIVAATLTAAGALMGFGLKNDSVAFIYPPLATFLAFGWAQNDYRIGQIAQYIRDKIEIQYFGFCWETSMEILYPETGFGSWRFVVLSHGGIFAVTELMAIGIGISHTPLSGIEKFLLAVDLVFFVFLLIPMWKAWFRNT